ncbi:hypothetical protein NQ318_023432 [Aromia moschata]|uniref:Uncharacterized protein n=1 Tax=Aromia moschata TaxID=1265417 RepID=A0AAV8XUI1_9CUCU|nr:hypothetical protein NQ318_023432 [Aromia moschata]
MDKVDKEELRVDKAVKVTRKELNDLIAELFECTEHCNSNEANYAVEMDSSTRNVNNDQNSNNKENNMDDTQEVHRNANSNVDESDSVTDNPEDINALMIASSTGRKRKGLSLKGSFLQIFLCRPPEDPEVEKQKSEMFALAYYDKMRETLELEDYHKIMQILNDHEEGDAVDLYKKVKDVLTPKYQELADEFLLFLREKEAAADQPSQLRKIYKSLTELSQSVGVSMGKIKNTLLPMFKGNAILSDLFLQNFLDERPPPSLLEGPYETIDVSKELSRPDDEEIFETITVPDVEDKYGGPSCICNCHQIEDPEFKSRYRHCIRCGTKFMNGKVYIQTGRGLRPATVSFLTSPNTDHNIRLLGKAPTSATQRKKRSETSPSKRVSLSPTKENIDEESEDDIDGKKKSKKKPPKGRNRQGKQPPIPKDLERGQQQKKTLMEKATVQNITTKSKVKDSKQADSCEAEEEKVVKPEETPVEDNRSTEECMEWDDNAVANESAAETEIKSGSPDHQTAESESDCILKL